MVPTFAGARLADHRNVDVLRRAIVARICRLHRNRRITRCLGRDVTVDPNAPTVALLCIIGARRVVQGIAIGIPEVGAHVHALGALGQTHRHILNRSHRLRFAPHRYRDGLGGGGDAIPGNHGDGHVTHCLRRDSYR